MRIPPGVDEGTRIRLSGEGEAGVRGGPAGDLYIFVHLKRHPIFQREGTTLFARCPISFTTAALGGTLEFPGLDRQVHEIRIPAGIQSGKQLRQRGAGMPVLNGRGHGDLVVQIEVETPDQAQRPPARIARGIPQDRDGRRMPAVPELLQQAQGPLGRLNLPLPACGRGSRGEDVDSALSLGQAPPQAGGG